MSIYRSGAPGPGIMIKGGTLTLRGSGFTPGQGVEAYFSDHPIPSLRGTSTKIGVADSSGSVSVSLPTNTWRLGRYAASLRQPGKVSNTGWLVLYDARQSVSLSSSTLSQGDKATLYARYYAPSQALYLLWRKHPYDANKTLRIGTTDSNGHANVSLDTSGWAPGIYSALVFTADSHGVSHLSSSYKAIGDTTLVSPTTSVTVKPCAPGSNPCELQGVNVTITGTGFVHNSRVVARWKSHPIATSVGKTELIGFSNGSGALNTQLSSAGWAPGTYVAEVYSATPDGRRTSHIATGAMSVLGPTVSIDECLHEGPHEGTGQSDSGPCAMEASVFHLRGTRFPPGADIVARWTVHPVSTSVGSVEPVGTAASDGTLSVNIDSRPWVQGLYEAEIYAQSGGNPVSDIVRMAVHITPPAQVSLQGCRNPDAQLDEEDRCYVKRGFPITLYGDEGGFVRNHQIVIQWLEHPDDKVDKTLTTPIAVADSSGFTAEFATTGMRLGNYKVRIYTVAGDGYRSSSVVEAKFAVENPDLAFHGYMSVDVLTQQRLDNKETMKFADDATKMHEQVSANAVLFNPTKNPAKPDPEIPYEYSHEVAYDYSWDKELEATYKGGMTAFISISTVFFESGQTQEGCVIIDHDGAAEAEELTAVFSRETDPNNPLPIGKIPKGTVVISENTITGNRERFRTISDAVFDDKAEKVSVGVTPEDASTRLPNHKIYPFSSYVAPDGDVFDDNIAVASCVPEREDLDLRSDGKWPARWKKFRQNNSHLDNSEFKAGFYIDEPIWRQITNSELNTFVSAVKNAYPNRPLIVVEADKERVLKRIVLPKGVDWFGIDNYELDPSSSDSEYKRLIDQAQAVIAPHNHMKLMIVGNAVSRTGSLEEEAPLKSDLAREYYDLARFTERTVALGWFAWSLTNKRGIQTLRGLMELAPHNPELIGIHNNIGTAVIRTGD